MDIISSFSFGRMAIHGKVYTSDLIIQPDGTVLDKWRRKSGHYLAGTDIESQLRDELDCIVVGTGVHGLMKLDPRLETHLKEKKIEIHDMPTADAVSRYNHVMGEKHGLIRVLACFHLTC